MSRSKVKLHERNHGEKVNCTHNFANGEVEKGREDPWRTKRKRIRMDACRQFSD